MKINFYPYDYQYKLKDETVLVHIYSKLEDGQKVCVVVEHKPFFYAEHTDNPILTGKIKSINIDMGKQQGKVTYIEETEMELLGKKKRVFKIYTNIPTAVPLISKEVESLGLSCYEKDILFIQRFVRDTGILPLSLAEAEGEFSNNHFMRIPLFYAQNIIAQKQDSLDKLKILAIDIETYAPDKLFNPQKNPILMIAFSGIDEENNHFQKLITWKRFYHNLDYVETVSDEAEMIQRFKEIIIEYKPDVLTGYFSDGFDLPYIKERADKFKIKLDLGIDYSELDIGDGRKECKIRGILHLDVFKFIRNVFGKNLKTDSYSLDEVSYELLGSRKHEVDIAQLYQAWDNSNSVELEKFCRYNLQDTILTLQLCKKLLFDMREFAQICGLPLFDVTRMSFSRLVESYIMKEAVKKNILSPNRPSNYEVNQRMDETYEGGFVFEPKPGLYNDIVVFDFRSLYPSIIMSHNIGPEAYHCSCCQKDTVPGFKEYWFCHNEKKFLPQLLENLIDRRAEIKKALKQLSGENTEGKNLLAARSYALKILANSFYGYMGYFGARWYSLPCARSTTAYARNYIKETIDFAGKSGFQVCYSDTDSCFLLLGKKTVEDALGFMKEVNEKLPEKMELEFEGYYKRGIFVSLKDRSKYGKEEKFLSERKDAVNRGNINDEKGKGAKKKYALLREDGTLKITGFETIRRNWSEIAKEIQEKVLQLVLEEKKEEAISYVREMADKLKKGTIEKNMFIIKTKITRDLDSYASVGPHVAVARRMHQAGFLVTPGMIVEYIIVKGSGLVRERAKLVHEVKEAEYDANYYLNNQIIPVVLPIFAVLGYSEENIFSETKQEGLERFF